MGTYSYIHWSPQDLHGSVCSICLCLLHSKIAFPKNVKKLFGFFQVKVYHLAITTTVASALKDSLILSQLKNTIQKYMKSNTPKILGCMLVSSAGMWLPIVQRLRITRSYI